MWLLAPRFGHCQLIACPESFPSSLFPIAGATLLYYFVTSLGAGFPIDPPNLWGESLGGGIVVASPCETLPSPLSDRKVTELLGW